MEDEDSKKEKHDKFIEEAYKIISSIKSGNFKSQERFVKKTGCYIQISRKPFTEN